MNIYPQKTKTLPLSFISSPKPKGQKHPRWRQRRKPSSLSYLFDLSLSLSRVFFISQEQQEEEGNHCNSFEVRLLSLESIATLFFFPSVLRRNASNRVWRFFPLLAFLDSLSICVLFFWQGCWGFMFLLTFAFTVFFFYTFQGF